LKKIQFNDLSLKALRASSNAKNTYRTHTKYLQSDFFNKRKLTPKTPFVISYYNKFSNQPYVWKVPHQLCHTMNSAHMEIILDNRYNWITITKVFLLVEDYNLQRFS